MWRSSLSIIILHCFFFFDAKAQLRVGPVVGAGVSKVFFFDKSYNDSFKTLPSFGFEGGFMGSMAIHKNFVLNAELLYSYRTKHIEGVADKHFKFNSNMQYIELPIFYVLEFKSLTGDPTGRGGKVKTYNWFVGGGPTISYWLSSKSTLTSSSLLENLIPEVEYKAVFGPDNSGGVSNMNSTTEYIPNANRFQFGINITGGLSFEPVGLHKIVAFGQFNIAQTFFGKTDVSLPTYDVDVMRAKNHSFKLSIAYLFDTKIETSKKGKSTKSKDVRRKKR
jgi:hypothetical protein